MRGYTARALPIIARCEMPVMVASRDDRCNVYVARCNWKLPPSAKDKNPFGPASSRGEGGGVGAAHQAGLAASGGVLVDNVTLGSLVQNAYGL